MSEDTTRYSPGAAVVVNEVSRLFGQVIAVDNLSLHIEPGEFLSILGPSGCGKSTLLRIIGGLDRQTSGTVAIDGVDVSGLPPERRATSTVFQQGAVFPHLSVFDNVAYPLKVRRTPKQEMKSRVYEYLRLVRLEHLADREPFGLSGGQLQRIALARALAAEPAVLLMDEPLSALDAELKRELQTEIRRIHRELGKTIIFVTHDQEEALALSDRIAVMNEGVIYQCDVPKVLHRRPANAFVARFLGHSNVLQVDYLGSSGGQSLLEWHGHKFEVADMDGGNAHSSEGSFVSVRPPCITIGHRESENSAPGLIRDVVFLGDAVRYELVVGESSVWAQSEGQSDLRIGQEVGVQFKPGSVALLSTPPA